MVSAIDNPRVTAALQWYALFGPPLAWTAQLVLGYFYTLGLCGPSGAHFSTLHLPAGVLTAAVALIAITGWLSAFALHLATSRGLADPLGRIRFLSDLGLVIGAIFLALILYTGAGELALEGCR